MNWEQVEGEWDKLKGGVKSKWAKLTDDDLGQLSGKKDQLIGVIQQRYGVLKDEAENQVNEWISKIDHKLHAATDKAAAGSEKLQAKVEGSIPNKVEANGNVSAKTS